MTAYITTVDIMDNIGKQESHFCEGLYATPMDLERVWTYFRWTHTPTLRKYINSTIACPELNDDQQMYYDILFTYFEEFSTKDWDVLQIETPTGGFMIIKTEPSVTQYAFVTQDLQPVNGEITEIRLIART